MKSEILKEYLEGDLAAEEELFARYEREVQVPGDLWAGIEGRIVAGRKSWTPWWVGVAAVLVLSIGLGFIYVSQKSETIAARELPKSPAPVIQRLAVASKAGVKNLKPLTKKPIVADNPVADNSVADTPVVDNPGVISTELGFDIHETETAKHIEQTENLLRTIRNYTVTDGEEDIDVTYDKALSRRLLIENVVLRRDAEMNAKFPTKTLLADLEPLLIDIANLPDRAKPEEVRAIKERVQKTEIVAALVDYRDK